MKQIIIATKNKGKIAEFKELFYNYQIQVMSLLDLAEEPPDVEETGTTFIENAKLKAEEISSSLNAPVLADDSGLIVDALNGRPGVFSARYAGEDKSDQANMDKLLNEMTDVPLENRTARFVCVLAIAIPGEETIYRTGYCEGIISFSALGTNGFGYDPIFIPKGYTKTMAEISFAEKSKISHRNNAIVQLREWLKSL